MVSVIYVVFAVVFGNGNIKRYETRCNGDLRKSAFYGYTPLLSM